MVKNEACCEGTLDSRASNDNQSPEWQGAKAILEVGVMFFLQDGVEFNICFAGRSESGGEGHNRLQTDRRETTKVRACRIFVGGNG